MEKIKVMHVVSDMNFGGAGRYLLEICKYINRERFHLIVVIPIGSILKEYIGVYDHVEIIEIYGVDTSSFNIKGVKELLSITREVGADLVHSHGCLSARLAARLLGVKTVYTRHSLVNMEERSKKILSKLINKFLSSKAIAVSQAIYNNLIENGESVENIYLIYNGVQMPDKEYNQEKLRQKYEIKKDYVITLIGSLEKVKGQEHMLQIVKLLKEKKPNIQILFAGEGSNRSLLERKIITNNLPVELLGHVKDIDEVISLSDVVVNTSNSEAISFALLEALSHKKPVVAFRIDGIKEVVEDGVNGYLVEFMDYEDFAQKLILLLEDKKLRQKLGQAGFEKVNKKFQTTDMVKAIEKLYGEIVNEMD